MTGGGRLVADLRILRESLTGGWSCDGVLARLPPRPTQQLAGQQHPSQAISPKLLLERSVVNHSILLVAHSATQLFIYRSTLLSISSQLLTVMSYQKLPLKFHAPSSEFQKILLNRVS